MGTILDLPIHVYTPLDPSRKCIAFIGEHGDVPIYFFDDTPLRVRKRADTWRREEAARLEEAAQRRRAKRERPKASA